MPNSLMKVMPEVAKARNVTARSSGGRGHDPAGALEADGDRGLVVAGAVVLLLDAGEQEDLVVHRQPEGDAEHQDRRGRCRVRPVGVKSRDPRAVAVLEDPDHRPERRGEAEEVQHDRLERHQHAAEHQEQQHEGGHGDDRRGASGSRPKMRVLGVDQLRRSARRPARRTGRRASRTSSTSRSPSAEIGSTSGPR